MGRSIGDYATPAAIIDVGWVNGLAAIRSLGRAGVRVLAVDHRPSALGFRSRYAERFVCPDPRTDETRFIAFMRALGEVVVLPTHDKELNALARYLDDLPVLAPFPGWELLERVQSKRSQLEHAEAAGIDAPQTRYPGSVQDARAAAEELGLPVVVKPEDPVGFKQRFRRQAFRCESLREVEEAYAQAEEFAPMVLDAALRLLRAFDYFGLSQIEFKQDARDGRFKLMEINPRLWQWHGLATACGVDLPRIAYADLTGESAPDASMNGFGKRWAITLQAGERPALQPPPYVDAVFAADDPKPGLVHLARVARRVFR